MGMYVCSIDPLSPFQQVSALTCATQILAGAASPQVSSPAEVRQSSSRRSSALRTGLDVHDLMYEDAMKRIEAQGADVAALAKDILSWIVCARRPLTIVELQHALAVEDGAAPRVHTRDDPTVNLALRVNNLYLVVWSKLEQQEGCAVETKDLGAFVFSRVSAFSYVLSDILITARRGQGLKPPELLAKPLLCNGLEPTSLPLAGSDHVAFPFASDNWQRCPHLAERWSI
jgi:hypothetical protein